MNAQTSPSLTEIVQDNKTGTKVNLINEDSNLNLFTEEQKSRILNYSKEISLLKPEEITEIGSDTQEKDSYTEKFLESYKTKDLSELGDTLNNIIKLCKTEKPRNVFMAKIFSSLGNKIDNVKSYYSTIQDHLVKLEEEFDNKSNEIKSARIAMGGLIEIIFQNYIKDIETLEALKLSRDNLINNISVSDENNKNAFIEVFNNEGNNFRLYLLKQKIDEMKTKILSTEQTLIQIKVCANDAIKAETHLISIKNTNIGLWKSQTMLYIASIKTRESIDMTLAFKEATNTMLKSNVNLVMDNSKQILEITNTPIVSLDTIEQINKSILDGVVEMKKKYEELDKTRLLDAARIDSLYQKLQTPKLMQK